LTLRGPREGGGKGGTGDRLEGGLGASVKRDSKGGTQMVYIERKKIKKLFLLKEKSVRDLKKLGGKRTSGTRREKKSEKSLLKGRRAIEAKWKPGKKSKTGEREKTVHRGEQGEGLVDESIIEKNEGSPTLERRGEIIILKGVNLLPYSRRRQTPLQKEGTEKTTKKKDKPR